MAKTTEGPYREGKNDALAGRPQNNTYGDTPEGRAYTEGHRSGFLKYTLLECARRTKSAINAPGARENADGSATVQMAKRSTQLEGIADGIMDMLPSTGSFVTLRSDQVHKIQGWMEQIGIIAKELSVAGK